MTKISRRDFFGLGAAAGLLSAFPAPALLANQGSNDTIRMGAIGCGGRCGEILNAFRKIQGVNVIGYADPEISRAKAKAGNTPGAKVFADLRQLIDDKDIDAVFVTTCNHWHCLAAIWAMMAGKDVYVEKPLSHSQWEGKQVVNAARKYDRICQMGTQQRSDPMQAEIKKFLHQEKALGAIQSIGVNRYGIRRSIGKLDQPLQIPANIDYNLWLGPAADVPLYRPNLHYDWHWDWNTGSGEMGNWGVHVMDDAINNVLLDSVGLPKAVMAGGARLVYNDAGQTPNIHFVTFDTGSIPFVLGLSNLPLDPKSKQAGIFNGPASGYVAYCQGGQLQGQRGSAKAIDNEGKVIKTFRGNAGAGHQQNFIDAVRAHDKSILHTEIELGNTVTGWCNLANIAFRVGKPYSADAAAAYDGKTRGLWEGLLNNMQAQLKNYDLSLEKDTVLSPVLTLDKQTERFVGANAEAANALLKRQYRKGFEVPEI